MAPTTYAIAIGSNRYGRHGPPVRTVAAAVAALPGVIAVAPTIASTPLGPSTRQFANTVVLVRVADDPPALLRRLKAIERRFGRRSGRVWGARIHDLDIVLWSGGHWQQRTLTVPHRAFRERRFVLAPLAVIAGDWRDPQTGRRVRHLAHLVDRPRARP
jgi:2-amino-4-hydroxy-6-hydroxymethyldihydropteridine diphosphokinase